MHNNEPHIQWRQHENGAQQPYSGLFQDVYYSSDNGLAETEYVFLQGNNLAARWQHAPQFTIIETGFGTGLNFLCAVQLWLKSSPSNATLYFISAEKYPLNAQDLAKALQPFCSLQSLATELTSQYASLLSVNTVYLFNHRVQLNLLIGDASTCLIRLKQHADAWFLDGFAPAKNPDMWNEQIFTQMARLSHKQTTFSTFTSAGMVRRGLQSAGFTVNKRTGFGKKREMLQGFYAGNHV